MIPLLLAHLALACDPAPSDVLGVLPADGVSTAPAGLLPVVRLGDLQEQDPGLRVELRDAAGALVEVDTDRIYRSEVLGDGVWTHRLLPDAPLAAGACTLTVDSPETRDAPVVHTFTVVGPEERDRPPTPSVRIRDQVDHDDEEIDPCLGRHRMLTITLDPEGFADEATLIHAWVFDEGVDERESPWGDILRPSVGEPVTLQFVDRIPDSGAPSCVTVELEDALGQRSEPATACWEPEEPGPTPEPEDGCHCASTAPAVGWAALLPLGLALLRRRR